MPRKTSPSKTKKHPAKPEAAQPPEKMVAAELLRQSEERFCRLAEQLPAITYIVELHPAPHTVYISPQVQPILGFTQQEWLSDPDFWKRQLVPADRDRIVEDVLHHNQTGGSFFLEYRIATRSGDIVWLRNSATYQRDAEGRPTTVHGVMQDITERKQAEKIQKQNEEQYRRLHKLLRSVADVMPDMLWAKDLDRKYIFANRAMCEKLLHARNTEEPIGKTDLFFAERERAAHPDNPEWHTFGEICTDSDSLVIDSGETRQIEETGNVQGKHLVLDVIKTPLWNEKGEMIGTVGTGRDITDRKRAEETLRITQQSYLDLLNSITEAIYVQDETGRFIDVNKGVEIMYGMTREELLGKTPADLAAPGRNDLEEVQRTVEGVFQTGVPARIRFWAVRKNGEVFPKDVVINRGRYFGKDVLIAVARDISEQVKAQAEKEKLQTQLAQAQKLESVGRLAGGVAHDFNNLLQVIFGNAELALEILPSGSEARENVEEIRKTAKRSAELTRQLLAFARKQAVTPQVMDLNKTVDDMLKMIKRLIGEGIRLEWNPQPDLPPVRIDPSQLDQILVNLCLNARDSMSGEGRLVIDTARETLDEHDCARYPGFVPGRFIRLSIRDNGRGIPPGIREHIFEPFFSTKKMGRGTGLGLATVYGIIQQNKGNIRVESAGQHGTTFHVYLPESTATAPPDARPEPAASGTRGQGTLLLVEDDVNILKLTARMLETHGYDVLTAAVPLDAIRLARDHSDPIRLLITDVVMPEMNGRTLSGKILDIHPETQCLYMSGYTADIIARHGILEEGLHFLQKPFVHQKLIAKVRAILDETAAE